MGDPNYQMPNRWAEVGPLMFPEPTPEQQQGLSLLEQKDRDMEDHWGGSGATPSIIAVNSDTVVANNDHTVGGTYETMTFNVPNDTGFIYYLDWWVHGFSHSTQDVSYNHVMFASIKEQSPGAGFEAWGFDITLAPETGLDWNGSRHSMTGHGGRLERVTSDNVGHTITLSVAWGLGISGTNFVACINQFGARLLAVPA